MAAITRILSSPSTSYILHYNFLRSLSLSAVCCNETRKEGWLSKLLHVRQIDTGHDSHSRTLSDSEKVYELQIHDVKPNSRDEYTQKFESYAKAIHSKSKSTELVGSFQVEIGCQDEFVHVWRYNDGYVTASEMAELCLSDSELLEIRKQFLDCIVSRSNQYMLPFSYWGNPVPAERNSMYELRSYVLKPGTMIEWGNNWARGITHRKSSAVAGFFSQIGQLYMVHHLWTYRDLHARKKFREEAWRKPGWDECVAYTVPLIREMKSRWLRPLPFSPIK